MKPLILMICIASLILAGCGSQRGTAVNQTLTVVTHDSFSVSEAVIKQFEEANNVKVNFLKSGDAGAALNKVILTKGAPLGDVFFGVDNTFLSRALKEDIFIPYEPAALPQVPSEFELDPSHRVTPVDYGDVCINYDIAWFESRGLKVPQTLEDLLDPAYRGLLVVENPATSSPGLAFLLATVVHFGEQGYLDYWKQLKENGVVIANDWNAAYYTNFSGSSGKGSQPMVVSYSSSPAAEVIYADPPRTDAPTASITGQDTCFRQVEFAGILKGSKNEPLAQKFIDFLLSQSFQEDIPLQMFMYPVDAGAKLPEEFTKYARVSSAPAPMDSQTIAGNRDTWIRAWSQVMLP